MNNPVRINNKINFCPPVILSGFIGSAQLSYL